MNLCLVISHTFSPEEHELTAVRKHLSTAQKPFLLFHGHFKASVWLVLNGAFRHHAAVC